MGKELSSMKIKVFCRELNNNEEKKWVFLNTTKDVRFLKPFYNYGVLTFNNYSYSAIIKFLTEVVNNNKELVAKIINKNIEDGKFPRHGCYVIIKLLEKFSLEEICELINYSFLFSLQDSIYLCDYLLKRNDIKDAVDNIKRYFRIKGTIRKKKGIIKDIDLITGQYTFISLLLYFFREISVKDLSVYIKKLYASKNFIEKNVDLIYSSAVRRLFKEGIIKKEERENVNQYLLTEKGFCFTKRLLYNVSIKNRTKVIDGIRIRIMESCISN